MPQYYDMEYTTGNPPRKLLLSGTAPQIERLVLAVRQTTRPMSYTLAWFPAEGAREEVEDYVNLRRALAEMNALPTPYKLVRFVEEGGVVTIAPRGKLEGDEGQFYEERAIIPIV